MKPNSLKNRLIKIIQYPETAQNFKQEKSAIASPGYTKSLGANPAPTIIIKTVQS